MTSYGARANRYYDSHHLYGRAMLQMTISQPGHATSLCYNMTSSIARARSEALAGLQEGGV